MAEGGKEESAEGACAVFSEAEGSRHVVTPGLSRILETNINISRARERECDEERERGEGVRGPTRAEEDGALAAGPDTRASVLSEARLRREPPVRRPGMKVPSGEGKSRIFWEYERGNGNLPRSGGGFPSACFFECLGPWIEMLRVRGRFFLRGCTKGK